MFGSESDSRTPRRFGSGIHTPRRFGTESRRLGPESDKVYKIVHTSK